MSIEIPAGLTELLQGFTVEVLRHQPADLLEFALQHFTRLQRENERPGAARCGHEGRTWGDAVGGGTPSKGVNFVEEPARSGSEDGEEEEEEEAAAAEAGAFSGEDLRTLSLRGHPPCAPAVPLWGELGSPSTFLAPLPAPRPFLSLPTRPPASSALQACPLSPAPFFWSRSWGARGAPCPVAPRGLG